MALPLASLWNRGLRQLENDLFVTLIEWYYGIDVESIRKGN